MVGVANSEDIILISDIDEIPNPDYLADADSRYKAGILYNFCMKWYMYYLNVRCKNEWFGTRVCRFESLKGKSIDLLRHHLENRQEQPGPVIENGGWHFSFLGGQEQIRQKLSAYSYQGRRSRYFLMFLDFIFKNRIQRKIADNEDIFNKGRKFSTVKIDSTFPKFILENQDRYSAYIKK